MTAHLLNGTELAKSRKADVKAQVAAFRQTHNVIPTLAILRVGDDEAAAGYARAIERNCKSVDVAFQATVLPADASESESGPAVGGRGAGCGLSESHVSWRPRRG